MSRCIVFLIVAGCLTCSLVSGQPPLGKSIDQAPDSQKTTQWIKLSLSSLVELRPAEGQEDRVVLVGAPHVLGGPLVDADGNTVKTRTETRTRVVTVNGNAVTQTYTVSVPYTTNPDPYATPRTPRSIAPVRSNRKEVGLDELQVWNLRGERVPTGDLAELMTRPLAAFVLRRPLGDDVNIDPLQMDVLREDALLIYVPGKRK